MEITVRQQSDYRDTNPFFYIVPAEAHRFAYDVVYTNHMAAGAYRGYGATQGIFAVESAVNEMAQRTSYGSCGGFVLRTW